jgi:hypothetical protein
VRCGEGRAGACSAALKSAEDRAFQQQVIQCMLEVIDFFYIE